MSEFVMPDAKVEIIVQGEQPNFEDLKNYIIVLPAVRDMIPLDQLIDYRAGDNITLGNIIDVGAIPTEVQFVGVYIFEHDIWLDFKEDMTDSDCLGSCVYSLDDCDAELRGECLLHLIFDRFNP